MSCIQRWQAPFARVLDENDRKTPFEMAWQVHSKGSPAGCPNSIRTG
ncbi:hypothetical protein [Methanosarcina sp. WWM596]|nr:hypothetical protein [Methanosarcina sp. WWM596]